MKNETIAKNIWQPITSLIEVKTNISNLGYNKTFITKNNLQDIKKTHWSDMTTGVVCFFEPLEVKEMDGIVYFRENDMCTHREIPEKFESQFGVFLNHNNGEFVSWLGKEDYNNTALTKNVRELHSLYGRDDYFIEGNYCDMFDCGLYTYAISNQMHMGLGIFKIIQINKELKHELVFSTESYEGWLSLEYGGYIKNQKGYSVIASGFLATECKQKEDRKFHDKTIVFEIEYTGTCRIAHDWNFKISSSNSIAAVNNHVYFGQNKMITRLNLNSGELLFLTNKSTEEIAALQKSHTF